MVILSPSLVILSGAKELLFQLPLRAGSAKDLLLFHAPGCAGFVIFVPHRLQMQFASLP